MAGTVLLFGRLKDAFGASSIEMPEGAGTAAELRALLISANPDLAETLRSKAVRIAVNQELVADEAGTWIMHTDEVALLPPLSGG
ncbi:MAG: MoaD/ThiS family protein [Alphaproteobacteria bacterium]|nr:MAG: MoaD/ThiS family protein [Alphaproteobacteria bacterium]